MIIDSGAHLPDISRPNNFLGRVILVRLCSFLNIVLLQETGLLLLTVLESDWVLFYAFLLLFPLLAVTVDNIQPSS